MTNNILYICMIASKIDSEIGRYQREDEELNKVITNICKR